VIPDRAVATEFGWAAGPSVPGHRQVVEGIIYRYPDAVPADKAYSSRANRSLLRGRRIKAVIPEPSDPIGHRKRRGSRGGRSVKFDSQAYKGWSTG
jgi:hypothetical protein